MIATSREYPFQTPTSGTGNGIKGMQPARNNVESFSLK
jgi:hypothetical protein